MWKVCGRETLEIAAGYMFEDCQVYGLKPVLVDGEDHSTFLSVFDENGRWFGSDPHGRLWAAWDGKTVHVGSWRWEKPPQWAWCLIETVKTVVDVEQYSGK